MLFRGVIDPRKGAGDEPDVLVTVNFVGNGSDSHVFTGISGVFGVLGFDEVTYKNYLVQSVVISLSDRGAWNKINQVGFASLGYAAYRRSKKESIAALA